MIDFKSDQRYQKFEGELKKGMFSGNGKGFVKDEWFDVYWNEEMKNLCLVPVD